MTTNKVPKELLTELTRKLLDSGQLIEAGWVSLRMMAVPDDATQTQLDEMRFAFFAGAQHLLSSIMGALDDGAEPTEADLRRLSSIQKELDGFVEEMERRVQ